MSLLKSRGTYASVTYDALEKALEIIESGSGLTPSVSADGTNNTLLQKGNRKMQKGNRND